MIKALSDKLNEVETEFSGKLNRESDREKQKFGSKGAKVLDRIDALPNVTIKQLYYMLQSVKTKIRRLDTVSDDVM